MSTRLSQNPFLQAALWYAERGIPVFPCRERDKQPAVARGLKAATKDTKQILQWWHDMPEANLAIPTGKQEDNGEEKSGWCVLDADLKRDKEGNVVVNGIDELQQYGIPADCPQAQTGGGGRHVGFAASILTNNRVANQGGWPLHACDWRGNGGYVMVWPSIHPSGQQYEQLITEDHLNPPPIPAWLAQLFTATTPEKPAYDPTIQHFPNQVVPQGELVNNANFYYYKALDEVQAGAARNQTLYACMQQFFWNGIPQITAEDYARQFQIIVQDSKPGDTFTLDEALNTTRSAYKSAPRPPAPVGASWGAALGAGAGGAGGGVNGGGGNGGSITWATDQYISRNGEDLRYIRALDMWREWNGKFWVQTETQEEHDRVNNMILDLKATARAEPNPNLRKELLKEAASFDKYATIVGIMKNAGTNRAIARKPDDFDTNGWHAVVANGVLDLEHGVLLPFDRAAQHTKRFGPSNESIAYDPSAQCPNWLAFLATIMDGRQEDIDFLQKACGYTLTGDMREQCWFLLTGEGSNGKSTFTNVIDKVLGTYGATLTSNVLMVKQAGHATNDLADLVGKRFGVASETEEGKKLDTALMKRLTGGDPISCRPLYGKNFTYHPKIKIWMHTNHRPQVRDLSDGMWRRLKAIPFRHKVAPQDTNKRFLEDVLLPELAGILTWMVNGCVLWQLEGLESTPSMLAELQDYQEESNVIKQYILNNYAQNDERLILASDAYNHYTEWCRLHREPIVTSAKTFGTRMQDEFHIVGKPTYIAGLKKMAQAYRGIECTDAMGITNYRNV